MTGIFGNLESSATQRYQDVTPTQEFFFFSIVQSIVYGDNPQPPLLTTQFTIAKSKFENWNRYRIFFVSTLESFLYTKCISAILAKSHHQGSFRIVRV
jgi:hypothetical protein